MKAPPGGSRLATGDARPRAVVACRPVTSVRSLRNPGLFRLTSSVLLLGLVWGAPAQGQGAPTGAQAPDRAPAEPAPPKLPPYHHSVFSWEHHLSTETVGVGDEPQTHNPTYTMGLSAEPRYYLRDDPGRLLSVRLVGGLAREFTNSDSTTQRGEWAFEDTNLAL